MKHNFIVIEGNIGSGKTTLAQKIAAQQNSKLMLEQFAENPFLPKFYEDKEKYAFPLELSFLAERYQQLKTELTTQDLFQKIIISDYYFSKSLIFAKANLKEDEFNLYSKLFNIIYGTLPKPDLLLYLYLDIPKLQKNILKRGRAYEKNISDEYLQKIQTTYLDYLKQEIGMRILLVDINNIDFVSNSEHYDWLLKTINQDWKLGLNTISL